MKKAIAFSGGGSKGSYQIGAWSALNEFGYEFDIAVGTSIGSINAAFYAQEEYETCKHFWENLTLEDVMVNGINLDGKFVSLVEEMSSLKPFLKSYLAYKGADITPFINNLQKAAKEDKFFSSKIDYALISVKFPSLLPVEITKKDILPDMLAHWINASCAVFPIFPMAVINGQSYIDGGYYDKLPIASAFKLGATEVFAVDLNPECCHEAYRNHPFVKYLYPSSFLGPFMNFEHDAMMKNMNMGYRDTFKFFGKLYGKKYSFRIEEEKKAYFEYLANSFMHELSVLEANVRRSGRIINKSPVSAKCTEILTGRLYYGRGLIDYFIAALEICADYFWADNGEIIDINDFAEYMLSVISESGFRASSSVQDNLSSSKGVVRIFNKRYKRELEADLDDSVIMLCVFTALSV